MRSAEPLMVKDALHGGGDGAGKHRLACLGCYDAHGLHRALSHDRDTCGVVNCCAIWAVLYANDLAQLLEIWIGEKGHDRRNIA